MTTLISSVAAASYWFHPLVWWASRQANRISERCCDEEVLANLDCKPSEYACCLLDALELGTRLSASPALPVIRPVDITFNRNHQKIKDLCKEKGIPYSTVRSRMTAGIDRIRRRLQAKGIYRAVEKVR